MAEQELQILILHLLKMAQLHLFQVQVYQQLVLQVAVVV